MLQMLSCDCKQGLHAFRWLVCHIVTIITINVPTNTLICFGWCVCLGPIVIQFTIYNQIAYQSTFFSRPSCHNGLLYVRVSGCDPIYLSLSALHHASSYMEQLTVGRHYIMHHLISSNATQLMPFSMMPCSPHEPTRTYYMACHSAVDAM